jgi:MFS family permease
VAGFGNTVGPLLGGWLTDVATWRLVFFLNIPVAAFAMLVTHREVPESKAEVAGPGVDYPGVALLSAGAIALLIGLDLVNQYGFGSALVLVLLGGGVALLAWFFLAERRQGARALVPADVLRNRVFAASCIAVLLMSAIFFAALLYLPQFMELVLHYSAISAGAGLLPMMGVFAATSFVAGGLYGRLGPRLVVSAGAGLLAIGIFMLSFLAAGSSYASLVPGMVVLGCGVGLFYSSVTTAAVTALDPSRSSLAGGIVYMGQIAGGAIGLGLNTAIVLAADSLSRGIRVAFRVDAGLAVLGFVVALCFVRGSNEPPAPDASVPSGDASSPGREASVPVRKAAVPGHHRAWF